MKSKTVWLKLLKNQNRFIKREDLEKLCQNLGIEYNEVVHNLQIGERIVRVLRGIFYVRSPDEKEKGYHEMSLYEMVAYALQLKGIDNWYFGLETALKLNQMTHEYFKVNYVITDSFRTTKIITIMDSEFQFLKWSKKRFQNGIIKENQIHYSDKEKTILDIIYRLCNRRKPVYYDGYNKIEGILREYLNILDQKKIEQYLKMYPVWMGELFWRNLRQISSSL